MKGEPDLSTWPTKAAAAAELQCSVRVLERRIQAGDIEVQPRRRPEPGSRRELVCNPDDIARLRPPAFAMPATVASAVIPAAQTNAQAHPPSLDAIAALLAAASAAFHAKQSDPPQPKPWLTLDEAAELSGLSQNFLKRACKAGNIRAVRDRRQWMIPAKSLAEFDGEATPAK